MEWVASPLHTTSELGVSSITTANAHNSAASTDAPTDLNGFVRFAERRNLVSGRVPSHFKRILPSAFMLQLSPYSAVFLNLCETAAR